MTSVCPPHRTFVHHVWAKLTRRASHLHHNTTKTQKIVIISLILACLLWIFTFFYSSVYHQFSFPNASQRLAFSEAFKADAISLSTFYSAASSSSPSPSSSSSSSSSSASPPTLSTYNLRLSPSGEEQLKLTASPLPINFSPPSYPVCDSRLRIVIPYPIVEKIKRLGEVTFFTAIGGEHYIYLDNIGLDLYVAATHAHIPVVSNIDDALALGDDLTLQSGYVYIINDFFKKEFLDSVRAKQKEVFLPKATEMAKQLAYSHGVPFHTRLAENLLQAILPNVENNPFLWTIFDQKCYHRNQTITFALCQPNVLMEEGPEKKKLHTDHRHQLVRQINNRGHIWQPIGTVSKFAHNKELEDLFNVETHTRLTNVPVMSGEFNISELVHYDLSHLDKLELPPLPVTRKRILIDEIYPLLRERQQSQQDYSWFSFRFMLQSAKILHDKYGYEFHSFVGRDKKWSYQVWSEYPFVKIHEFYHVKYYDFLNFLKRHVSIMMHGMETYGLGQYEALQHGIPLIVFSEHSPWVFRPQLNSVHCSIHSTPEVCAQAIHDYFSNTELFNRQLYDEIRRDARELFSAETFGLRLKEAFTDKGWVASNSCPNMEQKKN